MSDSRHHLRSVSDLYAADEIEVLLLEEIKDLEPPPSAYSRPEDIQDFEIAGSRTGGAISSQSSELDSPGVHSTVHSWDSHANYHGYGHGNHRHGSSSNPLPWSRASHLVLYCDIQGHLKTTPGVVRLLLFIMSVACLATLCSSGSNNVSLFMLPLVGRLRFMIFVAVFCLLVTSLLLFLDISHVVYMFPLNWKKLNFWVFFTIGVLYIAGCSLLGLTVWEYGKRVHWVPHKTRSQLTAAAGLALSCGFIAFFLSWIHGRTTGITCKHSSSHDQSQNQLYKPVDSSSSGLTLKDKSPKQPPSWVIKNQKSQKNVDSESNVTSKGNYNYDKYKENKKDHWASARQHFLSSQDDEDILPMQSDDSDFKKKRRRKKRDISGSNGMVRKVDSQSSADLSKVRRVPQKLPLQTIERAQPRRNSEIVKHHPIVGSFGNNNKHINNDLQNYVAATVKAWELESSNNSDQTNAVKASLIEKTKWSGQWQSDNVQPCSSKTVDPYTFS